MYNKRIRPDERPVFPKRAVITGGMPYGNKEMHFGHVGGMYVHADVFARLQPDVVVVLGDRYELLPVRRVYLSLFEAI